MSRFEELIFENARAFKQTLTDLDQWGGRQLEKLQDWWTRRRAPVAARPGVAPAGEPVVAPEADAPPPAVNPRPPRTWARWRAIWYSRLHTLLLLGLIGTVVILTRNKGQTPKERFAEYYAAFSDFERQPDGCPWGSKMTTTWKFNTKGWISECVPTTDFAWDELQLNSAFTASMKAALGAYVGLDPKTSWAKPIAELFVDTLSHAQSTKNSGLDAQLILQLSKMNHMFAHMQAERKLYESKRSAELEAFALPLSQGQKRIEETLSGAHRMMNQLASDVTRAVRDEALRSGKLSQAQLADLEKKIKESQDANTLSLSKQMQGIEESMTRLRRHCDNARKRCEEALELVDKARQDGIIENNLDTQRLREQLEDTFEDFQRWGAKTTGNLFSAWPWLRSGLGLLASFCSWLPFWGWGIVIFVMMCVIAVLGALLKKTVDMIHGGLNLMESLQKAVEKIVEWVVAICALPFRLIRRILQLGWWMVRIFVDKLGQEFVLERPAPASPRQRSPRTPRAGAARGRRSRRSSQGSESQGRSSQSSGQGHQEEQTSEPSPQQENRGRAVVQGPSPTAPRVEEVAQVSTNNPGPRQPEDRAPPAGRVAPEAPRPEAPPATPQNTPPSPPVPREEAPRGDRRGGGQRGRGRRGGRAPGGRGRQGQRSGGYASDETQDRRRTKPRLAWELRPVSDGEDEELPHSRSPALPPNFETYENILDRLHQLEMDRRPLAAARPPPPPMVRPPAPRPASPIPRRAPHVGGPSLQVTHTPRRPNQRRCANCNASGHATNECPLFWQQVVQPPVSELPRQPDEGPSDRPPVAAVWDAATSSDPSRLYYVRAKLAEGASPVQMLVDSGSSVCVMPTERCVQGGWEIQPLPEPMEVQAFNGVATQVRGRVGLPVDIGGETRQVPFLVVDGPEHPIVGVNALRDFGWSLDFAGNRLVAPDGRSVMCAAVQEAHRPN